MPRTGLCALALIIAASVAAGCSSRPSAGAVGADDVKPVAPPAEVVGKWRQESTDPSGKFSRAWVYHFMKDGRLEVDVRSQAPDRKYAVLVKSTVVKVEKDRIKVVELSHTGDDGVEDVFPAELRRRRTRWSQIEVKGDELRLTEVDEAGKSRPDAKPMVLKRVKE